MLRVDRRAWVTLALIALASLAGIASVDAQGENPRDRQEHRREGLGQAARRQAQARESRRAYAARAAGVRAAAGRGAANAPEHPLANYRRQIAGRGEPHPAVGARVPRVSRSLAGGQVRVVRYGNTLSGTVERTIRPGLVSRTFVGGGHVLYTRVYQRHVWQHFGRAFAYETFVPAMRYPAAYYAWALAAWPRPVAYAWGWRAQAWYPTYGVLFTPYPVYTSPDLWMTDYIIAQSLQTAYQAQTPVPAPQPSPWGPAAPAPDGSVAPPAAQPNDAAPPADSGYAPPAPELSDAAPPPPPGDTPPAPQSSDTPPAPVAAPPAITPQIKAQLNAQIKVQLQEQEAAQAMPATLTAQSTPPALRPHHVFFQVVQPLEVPTAGGSCSLSPDDYIKRTGGMSNDDWMIPVVVELSRPSDCPAGLQTRIGLNDLNAMENEQEAQVMEAMQAASKGMGPNGPPSGPGAQPTLIADGSAAADPGALDAIRQAQ